MSDIFFILAPIFLVIALGFTAVRSGAVSIEAVDGMMSIILKFGFPFLLFREISQLDLGQAFQPSLLLSFYAGAITCFFLGFFGARILFSRPWVDAVIIGFGAMFTNCLMLGVPITERAFGADILGANFAIISVHSPICLLVGVTAMELAKAEGQLDRSSLKLIGKEITQNPLMIGIMAAFVVNMLNVPIWRPIMDGVDILASAAIPAAVFGLGGVLTRCEPKRAFGEAGMVALISLLVHPLITWSLATGPLELSQDELRSAVLTAAMPTGMIAYVFAQLYGRATGAAASAVMFATVGSMLTVPMWLMILR